VSSNNLRERCRVSTVGEGANKLRILHGGGKLAKLPHNMSERLRIQAGTW
jgi:hypothetical protein